MNGIDGYLGLGKGIREVMEEDGGVGIQGRLEVSRVFVK